MTSKTLNTIAISAGEPAGIGPDIIAMLAQRDWPAQLLMFSDRDVLQERAEECGIPLRCVDWDLEKIQEHKKGTLVVCHVPLGEPVIPGQLNKHHSPYVIKCLDSAIDACLTGKADALLTAPIHKAIINEAGIPFTGHTEYLADRCSIEKTVMLFVTPKHKIALQTTHLPLQQVSSAITKVSVIQTLTILHRHLQTLFKKQAPRITVCGLNPHAGEDGFLGSEEIDVLKPAIEYCQEQGMDICGPTSADTAFVLHNAHPPDATLAMYHDQALPMIKTLYFQEAVNLTLGLPFLRVSVDHGSALSLAGTGRANADNLCYALDMTLALMRE